MDYLCLFAVVDITITTRSQMNFYFLVVIIGIAGSRRKRRRRNSFWRGNLNSYFLTSERGTTRRCTARSSITVTITISIISIVVKRNTGGRRRKGNGRRTVCASSHRRRRGGRGGDRVGRWYRISGELVPLCFVVIDNGVEDFLYMLDQCKHDWTLCMYGWMYVGM